MVGPLYYFEYGRVRLLISDAALFRFVSAIKAINENLFLVAAGVTVKLFDLRVPGPAHSWLLAPLSDVKAAGKAAVVNDLSLMLQRDSSHLSYFAAAGSDQTIRIFDLRKLGPLPLCKIPTGDSQHALSYVRVYDTDNQMRDETTYDAMDGLVCGGDRGIVRLWNKGFTNLPVPQGLRDIPCGKITSLKNIRVDQTEIVLSCSDANEGIQGWIWHDGIRRGENNPVFYSSGMCPTPPQMLSGSDIDDDDEEELRSTSAASFSCPSAAVLTVLEGTTKAVTGDRYACD